MEIDKNGYPRGKIKYSDLIHRQIAYKEIYLKNREKYPLPFSKYQVHHKNGNKKDFRVENLEILTESQHRDKHGLDPKNKTLPINEEEDNNFSFTGKHRPHYEINKDSVDEIWSDRWVAPKKERSRWGSWLWKILALLIVLWCLNYFFISEWRFNSKIESLSCGMNSVDLLDIFGEPYNQVGTSRIFIYKTPFPKKYISVETMGGYFPHLGKDVTFFVIYGEVSRYSSRQEMVNPDPDKKIISMDYTKCLNDSTLCLSSCRYQANNSLEYCNYVCNALGNEK